MSKEIEDKLKQNEQNTVKAIDKAFDDLAVALIAISGVKSYIYRDTVEMLGKGVLADIDLLLRRFVRHLDYVIVKGVANFWVLGENLGVSQLNGIVPRSIIDKAKQRGLFANEKAMNDFINRKSRNLTLSQRVWNLQPQIRKQIDNYPQEFKSWCRETKSSYKPNRVDWIDDNPAIKELFTK